jgi:hypothetical protein
LPKGRGQEHGILSCEDFDDLIWEEEVPSVEENTQWMAVVKVHTSKGFSQSAFFDDMRAAWSLARDIRFRILGANPFTVQFQMKVADIVDQFEEGLTLGGRPSVRSREGVCAVDSLLGGDSNSKQSIEWKAWRLLWGLITLLVWEAVVVVEVSVFTGGTLLS